MENNNNKDKIQNDIETTLVDIKKLEEIDVNDIDLNDKTNPIFDILNRAIDRSKLIENEGENTVDETSVSSRKDNKLVVEFKAKVDEVDLNLNDLLKMFDKTEKTDSDVATIIDDGKLNVKILKGNKDMSLKDIMDLLKDSESGVPKKKLPKDKVNSK